MSSSPLETPLPSSLSETREALRRALLPALVLEPGGGAAGESFPRSRIMKWLTRQDHRLLWSISPLVATYVLPRLGARRTLSLLTLLKVARPILSAPALWAAARHWSRAAGNDRED